jgi:MFS family permease
MFYSDEFQEPHLQNHSLPTKNIEAFRPRLLFCPLFAWNAITGGKFISTFLQNISPNFSEGVIGLTLSIQYAVVAILAGWGGRLADMEEKQSSIWGWGRLKVMCWGILIGTLAFLGHSLPQLLRLGDVILHSGETEERTIDEIDDNLIFPWNLELAWHIAMRILWAVAFVLTAPAMDGLALAHLAAIDGASQQDFGVERMFGAVWWGGGSLIAGIGIDYCGFGFLYAMAVVLGLLVLFAVVLYLWGVHRDTTGSFHELDSDSFSEPNNASSNREIRTRDLFFLLCPSCYGSALILFIFTFSIGLAIVDNLTFIFFEWLGSSNTVDGWTVVFTVILEVPLFYLSPTLLKIFGPGKLLLIAGVAYVIRVFGYTLVPEGKMWMILILETLHGVTYACSKTGSVEYIARATPKGYDASAQGLLFTIRFCGVVVGCWVGGWAQATWGGRMMYLGIGSLVSLAMLVLFIAELFRDEKDRESGATDKRDSDESDNLLTKSESACSSASGFADQSTEKWVRNLKYDSLNKYVKDW